MIRMIEKMEKSPEFSGKLGIKNKSRFKPGKTHQKWELYMDCAAARFEESETQI